MSWDWVPGKGEPLYFWPPCSVSLALVQTSTVLVAASLHPQERQSTLWKVLVSYSESWVNPYKLSSHFHSHLNAQVPDKHLGLFLSLALLEKCLRWTICWDSPPDIAFQVYQLCSPHQGQFCYWKKKGAVSIAFDGRNPANINSQSSRKGAMGINITSSLLHPPSKV